MRPRGRCFVGTVCRIRTMRRVTDSADSPFAGVVVWWASVADVRPAHVDLLDEVERDRRERYLRQLDRDRFTLGVAMTRTALGTLLGRPAAEVRLDRSCDDCGAPHGSPRPVGSSARVSVSHSGTRVAVAVTEIGDVGVDVEALEPGPDVDGLRDGVLAAAESTCLDRLPADARPGGFLAYWTRKEAALKATGDGLRVSPDLLVVSAPDDAPALLSWAGRPDLPARLRLHALHPGPGHAACLAVLDAPGAAISERSAVTLLGVDPCTTPS